MEKAYHLPPRFIDNFFVRLKWHCPRKFLLYFFKKIQGRNNFEEYIFTLPVSSQKQIYVLNDISIKEWFFFQEPIHFVVCLYVSF